VTHPTDPVAAMREKCVAALERLTRVGACGIDFRGSKPETVLRYAIGAVKAVDALPLPAAPANDAVREAREAVITYATRLVDECPPGYGIHRSNYTLEGLRQAVIALLAAERAERERGGDRA